MHIPALQKVEYTEGFKCVSTSLSSEELKIDIRRNFILTDALREGHKPRFSSKKLLKVRHLLLTVIYYFIPHFILKVTFVGESGVDTGGPKREFLRLLANVSICDKGTLLSTILTYHLFIKTKAMMDQFSNGLGQSESGLFEFMRRHEDQFRPLFVNERTQLTAGLNRHRPHNYFASKFFNVLHRSN